MYANRESFRWALGQTIEAVSAPRHRSTGDVSPLLSRRVAGIRAAQASGIVVTMVVLPSHAIFLETVQRFGEWPGVERSREALIRAISPDGGEPLTPIWDFTSYEGPAAEEVPAPGAAREMRWHWDAAHVKPALGDEVIRQIRSGETPRHLAPVYG